MRARLRVIPAAVAFAAGFAAPALAQDAPPAGGQVVAVPVAPAAEGAVGPAQLRDFSLQGTVTRRAETPAQPEPRARAAPDAVPPSAQTSTSAPVSATERAARVATRPEPTVTPTPTQIASTPTGLPTPDQTLKFSPATIAPETPAGIDTTPLASASPDVGGGVMSYWPWLVALLAALAPAPGISCASGPATAMRPREPTPPRSIFHLRRQHRCGRVRSRAPRLVSRAPAPPVARAPVRDEPVLRALYRHA